MNLKTKKDKIENKKLSKVSYKIIKIFSAFFFIIILIISIYWNINSIQSIINNFLSLLKIEYRIKQNNNNNNNLEYNPNQEIKNYSNNSERSEIIIQEKFEDKNNLSNPSYGENIYLNNQKNKFKLNSTDAKSEDNLDYLNQKIAKDSDIIENTNPTLENIFQEINNIKNSEHQNSIKINNLTKAIVFFTTTVELHNAVYSGNPYTKEYKIIESIIDPDVKNIDISIISKFQETGLPNNNEIIELFTQLIPDLKQQHLSEEASPNLKKLIINKLSSLITIRRITEKNNTNAEINIAEIKTSLTVGNLSNALNILETDLTINNPRINTFIKELKEINRVKSEVNLLRELSKEELFSLNNTYR